MIEDLQSKKSTFYVKKPNRRTPRPVHLDTIRKQNNNIYLLHFSNIDSRESAENFKGYSVYMLKTDRPQLNKNEYRIRDLVGMYCYIKMTNHSISDMNIYVDQKYPIGIIEGIVPPDELCSPEIAKLMHSLIEIRLIPKEQQQKQNDMIRNGNIIKNIENDGGTLCLVPLVPEIVLDIDIDLQIVVLDPPEGLLDLTYQENKKYVIKGYLAAVAASVTKELRYELESVSALIPSLPSLVIESV